MSNVKKDVTDAEVVEWLKQELGEDLVLPVVPVSAPASDIVRQATEQEATAGELGHIEQAPTDLDIDPEIAWKLHGRRPGLDTPPAAYIQTYGCQMNDHDSEIMYGIMQQMGYARAEGPEQADVLLFNTCAVRESAVDHAFGRIGQLKPLKYKNPDMVLGVCGCVPQVDGYVARMQRIFPYLDLIFGTHNIRKLPELIQRARAERETVVDIWEAMPDAPEELPVAREGDLKAWVTIIHGCNKMCTYCIVPRTRGEELSRAPEQILAEVQDLGAGGFKEITLLGQNVNAYGKDLRYTDFGDLVTLLDQNSPGIERIRFTTNHPKDFTAKMVEAIARSQKVCEWFHLPVQSGSDPILRRMKRSYNRRQYLELVRRVRELLPQAVITTDIIVGFPGETEADFEATLQLVEEVRYDAAFMFMYSPRAGTESSQYEDQVTPEDKKQRLQRLIEVQNRISLERNQALVGRVEEILVEGFDKGKTNVVYGRTRGNKLVTFPGGEQHLRQLVPVRITVAHTWTLEGIPVSPENTCG